MAVVYHWKHGWIPLDHAAALSKAKGNHDAATRMLADAHGPNAGIRNRRDVAGALLGFRDVPAGDHITARKSISDAATRHNATDLLPKSMQLRQAADAKRAEFDRIAGHTSGDPALARLGGAALAQHHRTTDSRLQRAVAAQQAAQALDHKAGLAASREREAARTRLTHEQIKGATHVRSEHGWHEVVRVNAKSVTVKTPYSWTETIPHEKIHEVRRLANGPRQPAA